MNRYEQKAKSIKAQKPEKWLVMSYEDIKNSGCVFGDKDKDQKHKSSAGLIAFQVKELKKVGAPLNSDKEKK